MRPFSDNFWLMSLLLALLLLALLLLGGCEAEEKREYWGNLYFGIGAYLGKLDLRDGSVTLLANLGDTSIREIDAFGDEQLLLTVFGPVNHEDKFRLMQFELAGSGLVTLINGRHGRYLPDPEALVYDDGAHLKVRHYGGARMQESIVTRHRFGSRVRILQVADTRFLYSIGPDGDVLLFDVATRESRQLPALSGVCRLDAALWITGRNSLLCKHRANTSEYVFVNLAGEVQGSLDLPDAENYRAVAHLDDQDALVLTERWNAAVSDRIRYAIWIYDLRSGAMTRLAKDQSLGSYSVYKSGT